MTSPIATATAMASDGPDTPHRRPGDPGADPGSRPADKPTKAYEALSVSAIGIEMALAILVGWAVGYWLDGKLGTSPWLMLVFLGFGVAAAFKPLIRLSRQAKRRARESNQTSPPGGAPDDTADDTGDGSGA